MSLKPVAIFRHTPTEGPGYFATFLEQHRLSWQLIAIDDGDPVPSTVDGFSGLCFMGGPMSVNDPLPWIEPICALIRLAVEQGIPVIGHCLGGQLISKALGGNISKNPVKEIGWGDIFAETHATAQTWLGQYAGRQATVFHWHGETFSLPNGAERLFSSAYCANQMFVLGPHLGMQCHVEMTPQMIQTWSTQWADEAATAAAVHSPSVQTPDAMQADIAHHLAPMREVADQLYSNWIRGLKT